MKTEMQHLNEDANYKRRGFGTCETEGSTRIWHKPTDFNLWGDIPRMNTQCYTDCKNNPDCVGYTQLWMWPEEDQGLLSYILPGMSDAAGCSVFIGGKIVKNVCDDKAPLHCSNWSHDQVCFEKA
jgi:hypothetical protein